MAFIRISSPHTHAPSTTSKVMQQVLLATLPGVAVMTFYFGWGTLFNIALATVSALAFEAAVLKARARPIGFYLRDYSALVTAVLLGIALPPYCPWWVVVTGLFFAIVVAKQLYGGLGYNPFNPAMVGYVVLLISFPVEMTQWAQPWTLPGESPWLSLSEGFAQIFGGAAADGFTGATPLEVVRNNQGETLESLYQSAPILAQGSFAGAGWEMANLAFLAGGIYLLYKKVMSWHAPVSMLVSLGVLAALFYDGGSSASSGSPQFHLLSGATMLGAFFIITDPVSSAVSNRGRLVFGAGVGAVVYAIRSLGNYPDAVAFAVLLLNFAAPFIDYYTVPRTYGHTRTPRATSRRP